MEPYIIDYYNEMPSGINVIDKMNEELAELQKENKELKKKLESYERPRVLYSSIEEWDNTLNDAYKIIKNGVDKWIVDDEFEYIATKLGITAKELRVYFEMPKKYYWDYKNQEILFNYGARILQFIGKEKAIKR